jgi:tight adherence protein C
VIYIDVLIPICVALCAFFLAYVAAGWVWDSRDPARRAVGELTDKADADQPSRVWSLYRLSPIGEKLLPALGAERVRLAERLSIAGFRHPRSAGVFMLIKTGAVLIAAIAVWLLWQAPVVLSNAQRAVLSTVICMLALLLPNWWLRRRMKKRQARLRKAFPDTLDMLVICVEAGLGLSAAMERVTNEIRHMHPDLAIEFAATSAEIRSGIDRGVALRSLSERTGLPEIRGFVSLLTQTLQLGTGVADSLRIYAEEFRDQRMQFAEERAAKIGTKMIFPLVLCEFPAFFIVAVGPAALRLLDSFAA